MSYAQSVTIGPEFFRKSFNDYRDQFWAFAREILQNSLDCGSTLIEINIVEFPTEKTTLAIVKNDGEPMTREILVGKLLSLGSSGKDFQGGTVGGFGKAKEILYFAHKEYTIQSGWCRVAGSGAGYNITEGQQYLFGTKSAVVWNGCVADDLREKFKRFISLCDRRNCKFIVNGEEVAPSIPRFHLLKPLVHEGNEWAYLGHHPSFEPNLLVVRIGGIPMFTERTEYKRTLVLELQGESGKRLTANRDSLKYPHSTHLRDMITQMAVDRRSVFTLEKPEYTRYGGPKLGIAPRAEDEPATKGESRIVQIAAQVETVAKPVDKGAGIIVQVEGRREAAMSLLAHEFIIKKCVRKKFPAEFDPLDVSFSDHAHWLVRAWAGCLLELYRMFEKEDKFSVGFIFAEDTIAEFEESTDYGTVYFLNPCHVGRKGMTRRYKKANRFQIAASAAHEFVHGGWGERYHDEDFASKLTHVSGLMLAKWRTFARHFK